jgi:hypothetical protein
MANKRIFFPAHQLGIKGDGQTTYRALHGVQSLTTSTTFNLSQVFELGQLAIYENIENIPDVEATITKVLDGYPLIYHEATIQASAPSLSGRSNEKCLVAIGIFSDTANSATGSPQSEVQFSGMYVNSLQYSFPLEDNFTEQVTLAGNNKQWANDPNLVGNEPWTGATSLNFTGAFSSNADAPIGSGGVNRRENMNFIPSPTLGLDSNGMVADPDCTILPPDIFGISTSGTNRRTDGQNFDVSINNISVSADLNRESIFQMGRKGPFHRYVNFPVQVTTEIAVTTTSGDMVSATEYGIRTPASIAVCQDGGNLQNRTIRIATCEGTRLYLGLKNKLASVNYTGGDATGGNVEVSYVFNTFNDLTVLHSGDPNSNSATWWTSRATYLVN